ncbi:hypothetical protein AYK20_03295 [Thermoplasmatales archaeon SG8-52-1]|nr:MAG: hypothetical protein AYK20_03295 [Thermoplasmatales archaeon SG8-52-1]
MDFNSITNLDIYAWVLLPLLIFFARLCDVSLGTIRIILVSKGIKYLAPVIGFFEILIWLLAIKQIIQNLANPYYYLFYAGGFAIGTYTGILLEEKLSIGLVMIRIITKRDATKLIEYLESVKYGLTIVDAQGIKGPVKIIFTVIRREDLSTVVETIKRFNPNAFYSIEDIRSAEEALFPTRKSRKYKNYKQLFFLQRKGK